MTTSRSNSRQVTDRALGITRTSVSTVGRSAGSNDSIPKAQERAQADESYTSAQYGNEVVAAINRSHGIDVSQHTTDAATQRQLDYIEVLRAQRHSSKLGPNPVGISKGEASAAIAWLKAQPYNEGPVGQAPVAFQTKLSQTVVTAAEIGYYGRKLQSDPTGLGFEFAKVVPLVGNEAVTYARKYDAEHQVWESWKGGKFQITAENGWRALTQEQAKRFGEITGSCYRCGRTLTDPESIAAGIGPVCAAKSGW